MSGRTFTPHLEARQGEVYLGSFIDFIARTNVLHLHKNGIPSIRTGKLVKIDGVLFYPVFALESEALAFKKLNEQPRQSTQEQYAEFSCPLPPQG